MCSVEFASRGFISPLQGLGFLLVMDPGAMLPGYFISRLQRENQMKLSKATPLEQLF